MAAVCTVTAYAVTGERSPQTKSDSLTRALSLAGEDTVKTRIRYEIGKSLRITRIDYWDSLLADVRAIGYTSLEYEVLFQVAAVCINTIGDPEKAKAYLEESITKAESLGDRKQVLKTLIRLIGYNLFISDSRHSIDLCYKGLKLAEELGDKASMATLYTSLGSIYRSNGDPGKALSMQFRSLRLFRELDLHYEIAGSMLDIGSIFGDLGDLRKKAAFYLAAEQYADEFKESVAGCEIRTSVAFAYLLRKQYARAGLLLDSVLREAQMINCKACEASILFIQCNNFMAQEQNETALTKALQALVIAKEVGFRSQLPNLYVTLAVLNEKKGNAPGALSYYKQYIEVKDSIVNENTLKRATEKEFSYSLEKKDDENRLLLQQNEIQSLKLRQNHYLIVGLCGAAVLVVIIIVLVSWQNRLRYDQRNMQLEQKLLRTQMNPHFIFNSLQAIQNFILRQDTREAVKYLSAFSSITRSVLESSRTDLIPLQKEIELLDHYLRLQKLRFGSRFEYTLSISDPDDAMDHLYIPPMLAQPFIENAVEHGMQGVEIGGRIRVAYAVYESFLHISITDNGYGIQQAGSNEAKHRSMAMNITRERIALMNKKDNRKVLLNVEDAFPEAPVYKGVKINITIPLPAERSIKLT
jgi:tetratricopeptide (TPR) repeat protein